MPDISITPSENGPYIVSGPVVLTAPDGRGIDLTPIAPELGLLMSRHS